jgi:hypothetical protein
VRPERVDPGLICDGFALALKHLGNKPGGVPAEVVMAVDALNPDMARQLAERMLKRDQADVMTGIIFSNAMLAVGRAVFESQTFYLSANAGPSQLAGAQCNPFFFNVAWQNDNLHEAMGKHVTDKDFSNALALAPNYPAGKGAVTGFRRFYRATLADEIYTALNQLDSSVKVRKAGPRLRGIFWNPAVPSRERRPPACAAGSAARRRSADPQPAAARARPAVGRRLVNHPALPRRHHLPHWRFFLPAPERIM